MTPDQATKLLEAGLQLRRPEDRDALLAGRWAEHLRENKHRTPFYKLASRASWNRAYSAAVEAITGPQPCELLLIPAWWGDTEDDESRKWSLRGAIIVDGGQRWEEMSVGKKPAVIQATAVYQPAPYVVRSRDWAPDVEHVTRYGEFGVLTYWRHYSIEEVKFAARLELTPKPNDVIPPWSRIVRLATEDESLSEEMSTVARTFIDGLAIEQRPEAADA